MMSTAGFYKFEEELLRFAPNAVYAPNFTLHISLQETYTYPIEGWHYFATTEDAESFFAINGQSGARWVEFGAAVQASEAINQLLGTIPERAYHGLVAAAAKNQMPLADLAGDVLAQAGRGYANLLGIGVVTSAAFVARIQPAEFGAILAAAEQDQQVAALVAQLKEARDVYLDDPRLPPALELLATAGLLAGPERVGEILSYEVPPPPPTALGEEWQSPSGRLYRVVQLQGEDGQFLPDDPTTPQRESLGWVEV